MNAIAYVKSEVAGYGGSSRRSVSVLVTLTLTVVAATVMCASASLFCALAAADRSPTRMEARAMNAAALADCRTQERGLGPVGTACRITSAYFGTLGGPARVSTVDARYGYVAVGAEQFSGALLKRTSPHSEDWRVVATQGSGINECSYWDAHASPGVVSDLRLFGAISGEETEYCGKAVRHSCGYVKVDGVRHLVIAGGSITCRLAVRWSTPAITSFRFPRGWGQFGTGVNILGFCPQGTAANPYEYVLVYNVPVGSGE